MGAVVEEMRNECMYMWVRTPQTMISLVFSSNTQPHHNRHRHHRRRSPHHRQTNNQRQQTQGAEVGEQDAALFNSVVYKSDEILKAIQSASVLGGLGATGLGLLFILIVCMVARPKCVWVERL